VVKSSWLQNGDVLCFLWDTNWIYIYYVEESRPLWYSGQSYWQHNGDVLCFLWGTNSIDICYVEESRPPLWSSGQSSWLQNGDVLCVLWGTNWIYVSYVDESRRLCSQSYHCMKLECSLPCSQKPTDFLSSSCIPSTSSHSVNSDILSVFCII
jgi:hypothetical protein